MRFEAKHAYFKSLAQSMGNFTNIPLSLATRHQQYQCYLNTSNEVVDNLSVGPGQYNQSIVMVLAQIPINVLPYTTYRFSCCP